MSKRTWRVVEYRSLSEQDGVPNVGDPAHDGDIQLEITRVEELSNGELLVEVKRLPTTTDFVAEFVPNPTPSKPAWFLGSIWPPKPL